MYKKNDKNRIFFNMCLFSIGKITAEEFCDDFYECYDILGEMDFTLQEDEVLNNLSNLYVGRYTPYESDRTQFPDTFIDDIGLKIGVNMAITSLKSSLKEVAQDMQEILSLCK